MLIIVIVFGNIKDNKKVKIKAPSKVKCPECKKEIQIGIEEEILSKKSLGIYFPHVHLHGKPLHALICYINSKLKIRNIGVIQSIEISRDSETYTQLVNKWSNVS